MLVSRVSSSWLQTSCSRDGLADALSVTICPWPLNRGLCCVHGSPPSSICSGSPTSRRGRPADHRKHRRVITAESVGALTSRPQTARRQREDKPPVPVEHGPFSTEHDAGRPPDSASVGLASSGADRVLRHPRRVCERLCVSLSPLHPPSGSEALSARAAGGL